MIEAKCNCAPNIRVKFGHRFSVSNGNNNLTSTISKDIRISSGNKNISSSKDSINKQDYFNRKSITVENRGIKNVATSKIAYNNIPQFNSDNKERLKPYHSINGLSYTDKNDKNNNTNNQSDSEEFKNCK